MDNLLPQNNLRFYSKIGTALALNRRAWWEQNVRQGSA